jgi:hypothetical protein
MAEGELREDRGPQRTSSRDRIRRDVSARYAVYGRSMRERRVEVCWAWMAATLLSPDGYIAHHDATATDRAACNASTAGFWVTFRAGYSPDPRAAPSYERFADSPFWAQYQACAAPYQKILAVAEAKAFSEIWCKENP